MFGDTSAGLMAYIARLLATRRAAKPRGAPVAAPVPKTVSALPIVPGEMAYPAMHLMGLNR